MLVVGFVVLVSWKGNMGLSVGNEKVEDVIGGVVVSFGLGVDVIVIILIGRKFVFKFGFGIGFNGRRMGIVVGLCRVDGEFFEFEGWRENCIVGFLLLIEKVIVGDSGLLFKGFFFRFFGMGVLFFFLFLLLSL